MPATTYWAGMVANKRTELEKVGTITLALPLKWTSELAVKPEPDILSTLDWPAVRMVGVMDVSDIVLPPTLAVPTVNVMLELPVLDAVSVAVTANV